MELVGLSLLALIVTEYGFRPRKAALRWLVAPGPWGRSLARLAIWTVGWWALGLRFEPLDIAGLAGSIVLGEGGALGMRRAIRNDLARKIPHAGVRTHFLPLLIAPLASTPASVPLLINRQWALIGEHTLAIQILFTLLAFCLLWTWATLVTVSLVAVARPRQVVDGATEDLGAGEIIGVLERLLIYLLILGGGGLTTVGFVVAAKSAARFPQFKDPAFAEYFLIGSLASMGMATALGLAVQHILAL